MVKVFLVFMCCSLALLGAPPEVARTAPANGEVEVDPELGLLRIVFDQPMDHTTGSLVGEGPSFPKLLGRPWWDDDRVFVTRWSLSPGHAYSLSINHEATNQFKNPAGEMSAPYTLSFKTSGEPVKAPPLPEPSSVFRKDLDAFFVEVDRAYPFFALKDIRDDWERTKETLEGKVTACASATEFLGLILEAIRCLRDTHMRLHPLQASLPEMPPQYYPGFSFLSASQDRVIIMTAADGLLDLLSPGTVVTHIDGRDARAVLEEQASQSWSAENPFFVSSPQRARLFVYRLPLIDEEDAAHTLRVLNEGAPRDVTVRCNHRVRGWPHTYHLPPALNRFGRSVFFGELPSGNGYIYLPRVDTSTEPGIGRAVDRLGGTVSGWIVDLRGNSGGGYDQTLIERVRTMPQPVAVLIDAGCISAGETLARDFRRYAQAHLMGNRTAGSSTSKRRWRFPSGVAEVTFSVRSRWRADGRPIEFLGIKPDTWVEADPEEVRRGRNSEIVQAEAWLAGLSASVDVDDD